ncbi:MAG: cell wall-active antibiotics response protein [Erysipelotrichaceae bacterium]|nr:cell wall-active antibiotics response protein [Erysipelotrichaceae bacterium]
MRKFIGLILVVFGVLVLADTLKLFGEDVALWSYIWPSILILFGLSGMIRRGSFRIISSFLIIIGAFYLAKNLGVEWFQGKELHLFAVFIVLLGIQLIFFSGWSKINRHSHDFIRSSHSNGKEFSAFMGGLDEKVVSDDFNGCSVTAVMGGAELDLSEVKITKDVTVECTAVMGAVELRLPRNVRIIVSGTPVMGGYENTNQGDPNATFTILVQYTAVMGAVEIR